MSAYTSLHNLYFHVIGFLNYEFNDNFFSYSKTHLSKQYHAQFIEKFLWQQDLCKTYDTIYFLNHILAKQLVWKNPDWG